MTVSHEGTYHRITVLTPQLVRIEYSPTGVFEDRPTLVVLSREFPEPSAQIVENGEGVEISTQGFHLVYQGGPFTPSSLSLHVSGGISNYHSVWRYGTQGPNLGGTARTLDYADGAVDLSPGLLSHRGYAILDDSDSLVRGSDGPEPRPAGAIDLYVFAHGLDYHGALRDYHQLTGPTPLIPRYALGNWWSRYHPYSEGEYLELFDRFAQEQIPFSVAVVDMDWHLTDVDPRFGSGWTGYTWNNDLFPDPQRFLSSLHHRGIHVSLNDHPADGVRAFEKPYASMAKAMGVDPSSEETLHFDVTDEVFLRAFFDHVISPLQEEGVDFWWLDWQSGPYSQQEGLDPLWVLNERHFHEMEATGRRPLIFSRYAGPGSHRYPVGFSGDSIVSWDTLAFQPEFTATASNIGFGWWSHDIGGHTMGVRDDELAARWAQLGVFSPINRLHSSNGRFYGKEPWRYSTDTAAIMRASLRMRHELVPYLYTMAKRASSEHRQLVEPIYHRHPAVDHAYTYRTTYFFGTELLVAPVIRPADAGAIAAYTDVWLPPGSWFDLETGYRYSGDRRIRTWRGLEEYPVFAKAGAILPLDVSERVSNSTENPAHLVLKIFAGADGSFVLYEDDGAPESNLRSAQTPIIWSWDEGLLTIGPAEGHTDVIPATRSWRLQFIGLTQQDDLCAVAGGRSFIGTGTEILLDDIPVTTSIEVCVEPQVAGNDAVSTIMTFLDRAQAPFLLKEQIAGMVRDGRSAASVISELETTDAPDDVRGKVIELLTAAD